jgi:hypothetical protein
MDKSYMRGWPKVRLTKAAKGNDFIAEPVMAAFRGPSPEGHIIVHLDGRYQQQRPG